MADDKKGQPLDPFAEVDDDEWFSAVDEWDSALDLPEETPDADAQLAEHAPVSAASRSQPSLAEDDADVDPLVSLIDGEMEVDPEGGQALGALLGSAPVLDAHSRPTPTASPAVSLEGGRTTTSRESPSMEIEIVRGDAAASADIEIGDDHDDDESGFDEATPPRFSAAAARKDRAPAVQARPPVARAAAPAADGDDDIDSILDNLDAMEGAPPAPPRPSSEVPSVSVHGNAAEIQAEIAAADANFDEDIVTPVARVELTPTPSSPRVPTGLRGAVKERVRHVGERLETPPSQRPDSRPQLEIIEDDDTVVDARKPPHVAPAARAEVVVDDDDGLGDPTPEVFKPRTQQRRPPPPTTATLAFGSGDERDPEALLDFLASSSPAEPAEILEDDVINIGAMLGAADEPPPPPPPADSRLADVDPDALGQDLEPPLPALPSIGAASVQALWTAAAERAAPAPPETVWARVAEALPAEVERVDSALLAADLELLAAEELASGGEDEQAARRLEEALQHRADYLPAQVALYGVHARAGRADRLGELGREVARRLAPRARSSLLSACADAAMLSGDDGGARDLAQAASEAASGPAVARVALVEHDLAQQGGDAKDIDRVLAGLSGLAGADLAAAVELDRGRLSEREGALEQAIEAYRRALSLRPTLGLAWEGIARCAARRDDVPLLGEALQAVAPLSGSLESTRRRRLVQLARWRGLEGVDVGEQVALAAGAASDDPLALEAWAMTRASERQNNEAIGAYLQLAEAATSARERGGALAEAAALAERGGDADQARTLFAEAAAALPGDGPAAAGVSRLQRHDVQPRRRLEAERAAAGAARGRARAIHHVAAAKILERDLDDVEGALGELSLALEHDAGAADAIAQLERLSRARGELRSLVAALDTAAEASEADARAEAAAELRLRAGKIYEWLASGAASEPSAGGAAAAGQGALDDGVLAVHRYRAVVQHDAERAEARWGLLRAMLASDAATDELAEQVASEAQMSSGQRAADLWARHAGLLLSSKRDEAEASARLCLGEDEQHIGAREILAQLAAAEGEWAQVAEQLRARAEAAGEGSGEQASLRLRIGALHAAEDPPDLTAATAALSGLAVPGARELLGRAYRGSGELSRLADGVAAELESEQDPAARFALLLASADLARRSGASVDQVEAPLRDALALRSGDAFATRALEHLFLARGEGDKLCELWREREAALGGDVKAMLLLGERLVEHELLRGEEDAAYAQAERMLDAAPASLVALGLLRRRLIESISFGGSAETAQRLAVSLHAEAVASSGSDALSLWLEVGRQVERALDLAEEGQTLDLPAQPRQAYEQSALDESHALALTRLLDTLPADDRASRAAVTRTLAERTTEGSSRAALLARAGELAGDDVSTLAVALSCDTEYLGAIYRLREAALVSNDWESALLATEAELAASNVRGRVVWAALLAGELAHDKLGDADRAAGHYRHALTLDPENQEAFDSLRRLLEEGERHAELSQLLEERLAVELSTPRRIELLRHQADLATKHLDDSEQAKSKLRQLLELDAEDNRALAALGRLYEADGEWTEAADALMKQCRLEVNPRLLTKLYRRLGAIYEDKLPDRKRAIAAYKRVVGLDARDRDGQQHLSDLYLADLDFENALAATQALFELETDNDRKIDQLLRIAKIYEDGLRNAHQASLAFRRANDMAPADLKAIGALCGFFARQGDQRSMMVHLDRSVAAMRSRLEEDPFEAFAYHALFRIFGWRKSPDACLVVSQLLDLIGEADNEEREFIEQRRKQVGRPGAELGVEAHDDRMFDRAVPGGFRRIFEMLGDAFGKIRRGDVRSHGVGRSDRITDSSHPVRRIADALARDFGVRDHTLYISKHEPTALLVENTDPPSVIVGEALVSGATEPEIRFLLGRCLWIARKSMVLPTRLRPEDLALLVAGVVRQYVSDFEIPGIETDQLADITKQVGRVIPRRMKQELMPFALECSGRAVELRGLGAAVIHSANRAGLLASGSVRGALLALRKAGGKTGPLGTDIPAALADNPEIETLVRFAVSDDHFELRRAMGLAIR